MKSASRHASSPLDRFTDLIVSHSEVSPRRILVAIAGPPGAGKSTLAMQMMEKLSANHGDGFSVAVQMDGFHLSNALLRERGMQGRKGAPETFDVRGLAALLQRITESDEEVLAPAYSREVHEPVSASTVVPRATRVVLVEGNYLLLSEPGWNELRSLFDLTAFLDVPWDVTRRRLITRQMDAGKTLDEATAWVDIVDAANDEITRIRSSLSASTIL